MLLNSSSSNTRYSAERAHTPIRQSWHVRYESICEVLPDASIAESSLKSATLPTPAPTSEPLRRRKAYRSGWLEGGSVRSQASPNPSSHADDGKPR